MKYLYKLILIKIYLWYIQDREADNESYLFPHARLVGDKLGYTFKTIIDSIAASIYQLNQLNMPIYF